MEHLEIQTEHLNFQMVSFLLSWGHLNFQMQDEDGRDADTWREELPNREEISQPDSEDSLGPEQVADELRRLTGAHAPMTGSTSFHDPRGGATAPDANWDTHDPYAPQRPRRNRGRALTPDPFMFLSTSNYLVGA